MTTAALVDWLVEDALPFWLDVGVDHRTGLFYEKLHLDGTPDGNATLRTRTMFRQVYCFSHAPLLGLCSREPAIAIARRAAGALREVAWARDGRPGFAATYKADGTIVDPRRDLYDHAFVLLGLAWLHRASGDAEVGAWIDETIACIDTMLATTHGGYAEDDTGSLPRRQNPHMHLFEAFLALYETTGDARHLSRAGELYALFRTRFFNETDGTLLEFFGSDWATGAAFGSDRLEPGHMMEWVWLTHRYRRSTDRPLGEVPGRLFAAAERTGLDPSSGFLVDEADPSGRVLVATRRLWPQTEYLKAMLVEGEAEGRADLIARADAFASLILNTYLAEIHPGCWRDRFDLSGAMVADHIPASILYHLLAPVAEIVRIRDGRTGV